MIEKYGLALLCLLLNFLAFTACLRFLFSRQGFYWVVPLLVTLFLIWPNAQTLYAIASQPKGIATTFNLKEFQPVMLSLFWYTMIVTFHYALKKTVTSNYHREQVKKNLHEARYQQKVETATYERRIARQKNYYSKAPARVPVTNTYSQYWTDLFDQF
ncbi:hypothetical protein SpiGrapes_0635 [Sphaerochaeta pleomorpha str. Grapes]|uniref:Uncharacterized protein n=1 Tax=Sphaerochaeta pleomorpha (strain ATCC BAA-1885 / DSM 22778 / Grapes) TaxID=158190 RepID=G8QXX2_SPHPG|nr:hypothetical protein [Sphaerochaeta pleomorpha]AEV28477.1 hypothetical protein SpiGrapes_0635 [Sphaerochaeta pleomorpha str. Grapes]